jgi:hypothetical protein
MDNIIKIIYIYILNLHLTLKIILYKCFFEYHILIIEFNLDLWYIISSHIILINGYK